MKMKLLVLSLLAATNVYANQDGVTLLEHIEKHGINLPNDLAILKSNSTLTSAMANPTSCTHGSVCYASGYVSYQIHNTSSDAQTYYVERYMCIENKNCYYVKDTYRMSADVSMSGGNNMSVSQYMGNKGIYEDEAIVKITGYESSWSEGVNQVDVS